MASLLLPNPTARLVFTFTLMILLISSSCINSEIHGVGVGVGVGEVGVQQVDVGGRYQREFDYFKLALQWPPTFCRRNRHCCSSNACCQRSNSIADFTIHGLWPDYNDGTWPSCCGGHKFNQKEISTLLDGLKKYWPSLSCGSISVCHGGKGPFWAHEWEKHGTCSSSVTRDEYNYFLTTLNVYFKYNVTKVLNEEGYVPSNSEMYPLGGIISAIQNAFHVTPEVMCSGDAIQELHLCFYKDFKPRDCNSKAHIRSYSSKSSCPKYVSLPAQVYSGEIKVGLQAVSTSVPAGLMGDLGSLQQKEKSI